MPGWLREQTYDGRRPRHAGLKVVTGPDAILTGRPTGRLLEELFGDRHQPPALSERGDSR